MHERWHQYCVNPDRESVNVDRIEQVCIARTRCFVGVLALVSRVSQNG